MKETAKNFTKLKQLYMANPVNAASDDYDDVVDAFDSVIDKLTEKEDLEMCFSDARKTGDVDGMFETLSELCQKGYIGNEDPRLHPEGKVLRALAAEYGEASLAECVPNDEELKEFIAERNRIYLATSDIDMEAVKKASGKREGTTRKKDEPERKSLGPAEERKLLHLFKNYSTTAELETYKHMLLRLEYGKEGKELGNSVHFDCVIEEIPTLFLVDKFFDEGDYTVKFLDRFVNIQNPNFRQDFSNGDAAILRIANVNYSFPLKRVGAVLVKWYRDEEDALCCTCIVKLNTKEIVDYRVVVQKAMDNIRVALEDFCSEHKGTVVDKLEVRFSRNCFEAIDTQKNLFKSDNVEVLEHYHTLKYGAAEEEAAAKLKEEEKLKAEAEKAQRKAEREARRAAKKEEEAARREAAARKREEAGRSAIEDRIAMESVRLGRPLTVEEKLALLNPELVAKIKAEMAAENANSDQ